MVKCEVTKVVKLSKSRDHPVIAHFQHGSVQPIGAEQMDCFRAKEDGHKLVVAAVADNVYTGTISQGLAAGLVRNFIAIRNKVTNKMRLVEVQESSLKSKHYDESNVPSKLSIRTAEQARKTMMTSFAGKAANRNLERKERMRINVDIVKGQLDKTMNDTLPSALPEKDDFDISMAEREEQQKAMLPKMNAAASKIDEIYELTDLISMDLLNRLESDAIEVLKTERTELPITSEYLLDIIESCQKSKEPDSANNLRIVKVCIYVDALISFQKKLRGVSKQGVGSFSDITDKVEVDIRHNFTQPATHKISKTDYIIHKVIAYALILSLLIVEKHEMSVTSLVTALNIPKTKLMLITTVLPVRTTANGQTIGLKLPSKLRLGGFVRKRRA